VLLLTAVVLVFLAILGAMFLAMARGQRPEATPPPGNIDLVFDATVARLQAVLREDVVSPTGIWFEPGSAAEPWDHASTNTAVTRSASSPFGGSWSNVLGGVEDDPWVSPLLPDPATLRWRQLSNLGSGYWVGGANASADLTTAPAAGLNEYPITSAAAGSDNGFGGFGVSDPRLHDATGDGYGDSRFEHAPIPYMAGLEYVIAVKAVDAGGLIPLLAGSALTSDGMGATPAGLGYDAASNPQPVRAAWATSLDLSRAAAGRSAGTWQADLDALFGSALRPAMPDGSPTPLASRAAASASDVATSTAEADLRLYAGWLTDLRWRGGFDQSPNSNPLEANTGELLAAPAAYVAEAPTPPLYPAAPAGHFDAFTAANTAHRNLRHVSTPVSGAVPYAYDWGRHTGGVAWSADGRLLRLNPNGLAALPNTQAALDASPIRARLERVFSLIGGSGAYGTEWSSTLSAGDRSRWAALCLRDYIDADFNPSRWETVPGGGAAALFGHEPLPYLREWYVQFGYVPTTAPTFGTDATRIAFAIELGNPFDRPIPLNRTEANGGPEVRVAIIDAAGNGTVLDSVPLSSLAGLASPVTTLPPRDAAGGDREHLVLISNPAAATVDGSGTTAISDLANDLGLTNTDGQVAALPAGELADAAMIDRTIYVALQVRVGGGWYTYDRLRAAGTTAPATLTAQGNGSGFVGGHLQFAVKRSGTQHAYLSNANKAVVDAYDPAHWPGNADGDDPAFASRAAGFAAAPVDDLNLDAKTDAAGGAIAADPTLVTAGGSVLFQLPVANRPVARTAELAHVATMGFTSHPTDLNLAGDTPTLLGGDPVAGVAARPVNDRFLNLKSSNLVGHGLNHAQAVLTQFNPRSPAEDGIDNDGGEELMFGAMNLNAAPGATLAAVMPYPAPADQPALLAAVEAEFAGSPVRHLPELLSTPLIHGRDDATGPIAGSSWAYDGHDGDAFFARPARDLYPSAASLAGGAVDYAVVDDGEDQVEQYQFFEPFTTRTDIVVAHIYAAGYERGAYDRGVVESARGIVVLDRSTLRSPADTPRVLAVYRYE